MKTLLKENQAKVHFGILNLEVTIVRMINKSILFNHMKLYHNLKEIHLTNQFQIQKYKITIKILA
jgi:hypothetical protein